MLYYFFNLEKFFQHQILYTTLPNQKIFSNVQFCILHLSRLKTFSPTASLVHIFLFKMFYNSKHGINLFRLRNFFPNQNFYTIYPYWKIFSRTNPFFDSELLRTQFSSYNLFTDFHFFVILFFLIEKIIQKMFCSKEFFKL